MQNDIFFFFFFEFQLLMIVFYHKTNLKLWLTTESLVIQLIDTFYYIHDIQGSNPPSSMVIIELYKIKNNCYH